MRCDNAGHVTFVRIENQMSHIMKMLAAKFEYSFCVNSSLFLPDLPDGTLHNIFMDVVPEEGDTAYSRLAQVSKRWCAIIGSPQFMQEHHKHWIYSK